MANLSCVVDITTYSDNLVWLKLCFHCLCRFLTNTYLREEAPNSHVVEQRVEWQVSKFFALILHFLPTCIKYNSSHPILLFVSFSSFIFPSLSLPDFYLSFLSDDFSNLSHFSHEGCMRLTSTATRSSQCLLCFTVIKI